MFGVSDFLFVLVCFVCLCWSMLVVLVFSCCFFWVCFCFVLCVCWSGLGVVLHGLFFFGFFVCLCFNLFVFVCYEHHCFHCSSLNVHSISVSHFSFWFLFFLLCVSRFSFVCVFSACCLALWWITILDFLLLCIVFSCCCFCFGILFWGFLATYQKTSPKKWKFWTPAKWKKNTDILTRAISTDVFTIMFFFLCVFKCCILCWKHYKNSGFGQKQKHRKLQIVCVKNWSTYKLKKLVQVCCASKLDQFLTHKLPFGGLFLLLFWQILFFLQGERDFRKQKAKKKTKHIEREHWTRK